MSAVTILAAAAVLLSATSSLPAVYHGEWSQDVSACGGENTRGVLIEPTKITFYEARGTVLHASEGAKGASARVEFTGEGRTWEEAIRLDPLGYDHLELTALGQKHIYYRCPDGSS